MNTSTISDIGRSSPFFHCLARADEVELIGESHRANHTSMLRLHIGKAVETMSIQL